MDYTNEQIKAAAEMCVNRITCECCEHEKACELFNFEIYARRLLALESENADLRAKLAESEKREKAANETIQRMAHDMVCFGNVDYWLCDAIPKDIHLKYQPKNDGEYANEPCYKCIEEYYRRGVQAEKE